MNLLVSALIPTRGRLEGLRRTIQSMVETASHPERLQFVLKVDDDDEASKCVANWDRCKMVVSPRGIGYLEMPRFVGEAADQADAPWTFLIDDDSWIEGKGWDDQLAAMPPNGCVAQCEFYHLGRSEYGSGSCGPNGLFVPTQRARTIQRGSGAADVMLLAMTAGSGWPKHLLRGITYCHDGRAR